MLTYGVWYHDGSRSSGFAAPPSSFYSGPWRLPVRGRPRPFTDRVVSSPGLALLFKDLRPASVRSPRSRRVLVGSRTSSRGLSPLQRSQLGEFTSRNRTWRVDAGIPDAGSTHRQPEGCSLSSWLHPTFRGHPLPDSRRIGRRLWTAWPPSGALRRYERHDWIHARRSERCGPGPDLPETCIECLRSPQPRGAEEMITLPGSIPRRGFPHRFGPPPPFLTTLTVSPSPSLPTCFSRSRSWGLVRFREYPVQRAPGSRTYVRSSALALLDSSNPFRPRGTEVTPRPTRLRRTGGHGWRSSRSTRSLRWARPYASDFRRRPDRCSRQRG
jgi:hypothetical protein